MRLDVLFFLFFPLRMVPFTGMSKISFADCADAMLSMLSGKEEWRHKAPIVRY